jgi:hypothetical protein
VAVLEEGFKSCSEPRTQGMSFTQWFLTMCSTSSLTSPIFAQEVRNEFIGRLGAYLTLLQKLPGSDVSLLAPLLNHLPDSFQGDVEPLQSASRYTNEFVGTRNQRFEICQDPWLNRSPRKSNRLVIQPFGPVDRHETTGDTAGAAQRC